MTLCPEPPYSPGLASRVLWLLPKVKTTTKGQCFGSAQDTEAEITAKLKMLRKEGSRATAEEKPEPHMG